MNFKANGVASAAAKSTAGNEGNDRITAFDEFYSAFQNAASRTGGATAQKFKIAGRIICLRFAGTSLVPYLTKALAHHAVSPEQNPDLTINIWDTRSSGQPLPETLKQSLHLNPDIELAKQVGLRGEVPKFSDRRFHCSLQLGPDILTFLDKDRNRCVYWINDVNALPVEKTGSPFRSVLHWHFGSTSRQLVHAGAVGAANGGALLAGSGGAGKSTTALNCVLDGMDYCGDDYVLVDLDPDPHAFGIYQTVKIKTFEDLARFDEAKSWPLVENNDTASRPMIFLGNHRPGQLTKKLPLKSIIFPRFVSGESVAFTKMSQRESFCEMVPSNIKQMAFADKDCLKMLAELSRSLPSYSLIFGEDQSGVSSAVRQIIGEGGVC